MATLDKRDPAYAGQAIYTRQFLAVYDAIVYGFNSPVLWRCSKRQFVQLYNAHVSGRHLDIGVGTGRLLDECRFPTASPQITLMDLNRNSLVAASRRLARYRPRSHQANALTSWGLAPESFDSVAISHLLHCLPGAIADKSIVFENARQVLSSGGVLFGATILGERERHTALSWLALKANNRQGTLSNLDDRLDDLDVALGRAFTSHEVKVQGAVALFYACA